MPRRTLLSEAQSNFCHRGAAQGELRKPRRLRVRGAVPPPRGRVLSSAGCPESRVQGMQSTGPRESRRDPALGGQPTQGAVRQLPAGAPTSPGTAVPPPGTPSILQPPSKEPATGQRLPHGEEKEAPREPCKGRSRSPAPTSTFALPCFAVVASLLWLYTLLGCLQPSEDTCP